jgi:predicted amidohydrolase YtcJ
VVVPGFTDAHCHLIFVGLLAVRPNLEEARSRGDVVARIRAALEDAEADTVLAEGWDESTWPTGERALSGADLDRLSSDRPIVARRACTHLAVANRAALRFLEGVDGTDMSTGTLLETAAMTAGQHLPGLDRQRERAVAHAVAEARRNGVTGVHEFGKRVDLRPWASADLDIRLRFFAKFEEWTTDPEGLDAEVRSATGRPIAGIKFFADGSFGARTAAVDTPYAGMAARGTLLWEDAALESAIRRVHDHGLPTATHAIGDRAVARCLNLLERTGVVGDRLEHVELVRPGDADRMARLGVTASMQPNFIRRWGMAGGLYERVLGRERAARSNPYAELARAGVPLAFGSDAMPIGPLYGLMGAIEHPVAEQRLSVVDAVVAATRGGPASVDERAGSIEVGADADLAVLDVKSLNADAWRHASVTQTVVGGRLVYERGS